MNRLSKIKIDRLKVDSLDFIEDLDKKQVSQIAGGQTTYLTLAKKDKPKPPGCPDYIASPLL